MKVKTRACLFVMGMMSGVLTGCEGRPAGKIVPVAPLTGGDLEAFEKLQKAIHDGERTPGGPAGSKGR